MESAAFRIIPQAVCLVRVATQRILFIIINDEGWLKAIKAMDRSKLLVNLIIVRWTLISFKPRVSLVYFCTHSCR